ncbi:TPA: aspartate aminotransferase family protein [bacterium]|nr:MAG: aspartate aminotransferase family protein [Candidatus Hydrogenedentes bacterium CG1_02_42_14]PIU48414.1 MAG: aspartate aminotransferase family protein [Candidatus Hydrogenedentes bacterium CG07_land_8_20_14_0_80_42_17]HBW47411.1 aspartate aminotransferase family protein [bacterium]
MSDKNFIEESEKYLMNTYARQPVAFVKGHGVTLVDSDGKEYLDFLAGISVCSLGHSHPSIVAAIQNQAAELIHTSNLFHIPNQSKIARYLVDLSFGDKVFFCNSGAEANEGAIKLARRYQSKIAGKPEKKTILSFNNSFHGRTLATLAATGQEKYRDGFEPIPQGFIQVPYNDIDAVKNALDKDPAIGAILIEPIQAEGGVIPAKKEFMKELRKITYDRNIVLIFDEVQTGIGRTGKLFAYEHYDIAPDVMTLAKGLGGGIPIGAVVASEHFAKAFVPGTHASTFGGNHLATAVAIAVMKTILNDQLVDRAAATGEFIMKKLRDASLQEVKEVRGKGLLIGIELDKPAAPIISKMREKGFIIGSAGEKVIRLAPPLIVSEIHAAKLVNALIETIKAE